MAVLVPMAAGAQEPYAVLSDDNTVLTFYYNDQKEARGGMDVGPFADLSARGWYNQSESITSVVFDASFADCTTLTSTALWFFGFANLSRISGISNLNTDNVTEMYNMFSGCRSLTSLDVSGFNTDNVTYMGGMFMGCSGLTSLDVSGFKTDNVTDMRYMFSGCSGLTSLDLSGFMTEYVTNMDDMFYGCSGLMTIYAGDGWSTARVKDGHEMFSGCTSLLGGAGTYYDANYTGSTYARIDGGADNPGYFTAAGAEPWHGSGEPEPYAVLSDDDSVLTFYYDGQKAARRGMGVWLFSVHPSFQSWSGQGGSITSVVFDDSFAEFTTLTSTANWFYGFKNLNSITGISNLKTENVTDMSYMFCDCSGLTSLDLLGFNTENVTNMYSMFSNCSGLTSLDLSGFKTDNVTNMGHMFSWCEGLTSLDVSGFKTDNVTRMNSMFLDCSGLTSLDVSGFNTANVTDMYGMFRGCSGLTSLDVTGFKTYNVTNMEGMFNGCSSLTSLDLSGFRTDYVTSMGNMFSGCSSLMTIYAGDGWSTAKVASAEGMFSGCVSLVGGAGTRWDDRHTNYIYAHIDEGSDYPGYFTEKSGGSGKWEEGDLNHDGKVDAADVVTLVKIIMSRK